MSEVTKEQAEYALDQFLPIVVTHNGEKEIVRALWKDKSIVMELADNLRTYIRQLEAKIKEIADWRGIAEGKDAIIRQLEEKARLQDG